jgi:hypothetical protein
MGGLQVSTRLCPPERAELCTYSRWFHIPSRATLSRILWSRMNVSTLRVLSPQHGVHNLPVGRPRGVPRSQRLCDRCQGGLVGDEHHLVQCLFLLALQPIRDHYPHLFRSPVQSLHEFVKLAHCWWLPSFLIDSSFGIEFCLGPCSLLVPYESTYYKIVSASQW